MAGGVSVERKRGGFPSGVTGGSKSASRRSIFAPNANRSIGYPAMYAARRSSPDWRSKPSRTGSRLKVGPAFAHTALSSLSSRRASLPDGSGASALRSTGRAVPGAPRDSTKLRELRRRRSQEVVDQEPALRIGDLGLVEVIKQLVVVKKLFQRNPGPLALWLGEDGEPGVVLHSQRCPAVAGLRACSPNVASPSLIATGTSACRSSSPVLYVN